MMKTRLLKGRPRLVPPDDYERPRRSRWVSNKDSEESSLSSASSDMSEDSEDMDTISTHSDFMDETERDDDDEFHDEDDDETEVDDDDDDDEDDQTHNDGDTMTMMDNTVELRPSEDSQKSSVQYDELTPLFKSIEDEDWESVLKFLESGSWGWKWSSLCGALYQIKEKSATAQVRTWVCARDPVTEKVLSRLPLHAAIARNAPIKIIQELVKSYEKGVACPDSERNLPLHLAFKKDTPISILTLLIREYPDAIHAKNAADRTPAECGNHEVAELVTLCTSEAKRNIESDLNREKGNLEEDRKQLLEVTKELMHLKKLVAERERNMTKENFVYQKQQLSGAINELTRLKVDLDKHEENALKTHLAAERKRMEGVMGELVKTKGELEKIKGEKNIKSPVANVAAVQAPATLTEPNSFHQNHKKKKSKKFRKLSQSADNVESTLSQGTSQADSTAAKLNTFASLSSADGASGDVWTRPENINLGTDFQHLLEESREPTDDPSNHSPSHQEIKSTGSQPQAKKPLKNVAARFKKKMNWRKEKQQHVAETE